MGQLWITTRPRRRAALALPLLLSACAGTVCSDDTAMSLSSKSISERCEITNGSGQVDTLSCEGGRIGFAVSVPPDIRNTDETR